MKKVEGLNKVTGSLIVNLKVFFFASRECRLICGKGIVTYSSNLITIFHIYSCIEMQFRSTTMQLLKPEGFSNDAHI